MIDKPRLFSAIQTRVNGYHCRSRLEARWIVFFTELGFEFWYEPEGYRLSNGLLYLPDFYFPQIRMYGEVKPEVLTRDEMDKAGGLVLDSGKALILLVGPPDFKTYDAIWPDNSYPTEADVVLDIAWHPSYYQIEKRLYADTGGIGWTSESDFTDEYKSAIYKSRSVRFEEIA
jgi:hypothetical protein